MRASIAHYERLYESGPGMLERHIDWISGWPWTSDAVSVSFRRNGRQKIVEFAAQLEESDAGLAARVMTAIHREQSDRG